uniref:HECT domain-containing protein n=1 Tax=Poecilia latipinna TaxID=48699 RepID=A0A3B3VIE7_9TELE
MNKYCIDLILYSTMRLKRIKCISVKELINATEPLVKNKHLLVQNILMFQVEWTGNSWGTGSEERTVTFWRDYLQDVEEGGPSKLGKILAFATGATIIPPAGFSPQPSIEFLHEQSIHPSRQLPMANTCIHPLKLPMLETYDHFKESMDFGGHCYGHQ